MSENTVMPVVRVAVLADARLVDVVLPTELPLREIVPAVHRLVSPSDTPPVAPRPLSLGPVGRGPYSLDTTLDTVGVVDGDLLVLRHVPAGPAAPGIVEDIADAAVIFSDAHRKSWDIRHIRLAARIAVLALILIATALAVGFRIVDGGAPAWFGLCAIAAVAVVAALWVRSKAPRAGSELAVAALAPVAAALACAIPGQDWAPHVVLAAAAVTAWALVCLITGDSAVGFFTGVAVAGVGVLAASGAAALWHLPVVSLGCALLLLALLVTVRAAQLSALCARLPVPVIPAPGDPTPSAPSLRVLADLPRRVQVSDALQTGFIAGSVVLAVMGSVAIAMGSPGPWGWYLIAAAAAAAVLRARVWDSAPCKAWLIAHPHLTLVALLVYFALGGRYILALAALGVLAMSTVVWIVVALNPRVADPDSYSLPMRRAVGFLAATIDASLIPVMAYTVGIFDWVLNR